MSSDDHRVVLAIDPGHRKCGLAVVARHSRDEDKLEILARSIEATEDVEPKIEEYRDQFGFRRVIVGNGTTSRQLISQLRELLPGTGILRIDEKNTTLQARERYWEENPRRGWRRLLPSTMQAPPEDVDDFVAVILAERVLLEP
jgi:RNase H-fold protein (predicted Holliday junction resolvase)